MVVFNLDKGITEDQLQHFEKHIKKIKLYDYDLPGTDALGTFANEKGDAGAVFDQICRDFKKACDNPKVGQIQLDTSSVFYQLACLKQLEIVRQARGGETQLHPTEYRQINMWIRGAYNYARDKGKTLYLTSHAREIYAAGDKGMDIATGEFERDSWSHTGAECNLEFKLLRTAAGIKMYVEASRYVLMPTTNGLASTWDTVEELCRGLHKAKQS